MNLSDALNEIEWERLVSVVQSLPVGHCPTIIQAFAYDLLDSLALHGASDDETYYALRRSTLTLWTERN
jgi:hypothetical protein